MPITMKRLITLFSLIPHLLYAQYQSKEFMLLDERNTATYQVMDLITTKDSIVGLNASQPISGFFISGTTILEDINDCYARVTIQDKNGLEYLVYEIYQLISDEHSSQFSKVGLETTLLDNVVPENMKIEVYGASIQIDSIYFSGAQNMRNKFPERLEIIRREQTNKIAEKLNTHLKDRNLTWVAGPTSIALKSFEEKKKMFGPNVPCLYGFDYYKGGLYIQNPYNLESQNTRQDSTQDNNFVKEFDWRNRHGKNWITPARKQERNSCWDFATVATIESNFNIYFNQVFEDSIINLSEMELIACLDNDNKTPSSRLNIGGHVSCALDYIKRKGIVRDTCYTWDIEEEEINCDDKCEDPIEIISFSSFRSIFGSTFTYTSSREIVDTLKKAIMKSPIAVDRYRVPGPGGHSVSCVGFQEIQFGDTLCNSFSVPFFCVVDSTYSNLVGMTGWIIKNSWGSDWGENGFAKMAFENARYTFYEVKGPYTSLVYSDTDRCVTDNDMDGYYTWGSGSKPINLPIWIPDEQDDDDTNPYVGPADEYGKCDTLTTFPAITWHIDSDITYNYTDNYLYPNIFVLQNGTLTVSDSSLVLKKNATIRVMNGGKLIVTRGQIHEADIVIESGGTLIIDNGGIIKLRSNGKCHTEQGAKVIINNGKII